MRLVDKLRNDLGCMSCPECRMPEDCPGMKSLPEDYGLNDDMINKLIVLASRAYGLSVSPVDIATVVKDSIDVCIEGIKPLGVAMTFLIFYGACTRLARTMGEAIKHGNKLSIKLESN